MKNEKGVVIGINKGITKKGNPFTVFNLKGEFEDYQLESNDIVGHDVESIYIGKNYFDDIKLNDEVQILYGKSFDGKAFVKDLIKISK